MDWVLRLLEECYIYRYSTIGIVETGDLRHSIIILLKKCVNIRDAFKDSDVPLPERVIFYSGTQLYEPYVEEGRIKLRKISLGEENIFQSGDDNIVTPLQALSYYRKLVYEEGRILMIFSLYGFPRDSIVTLYPMISEIIADPSLQYQRSGSMLIFIVDDREKLAPFIGNSIHVHDEVSDDEIRSIVTRFRAKMSKYGYSIDVSDDKIIELLRGLEYKDVENIIAKIGQKMKSLKPEEAKKLNIIHEIISERNRIIIQQLPCLEPIEPKHGFEAVGGYSDVKEIVRRTFINIWKHRDLARSLGAELPKGMLLFGIRGTGKTWFVKCMAKELDLPMYRFIIESVKSKWYGESERALRHVFKMLRKIQPVILFIDEIDKLMTERGGQQEHEVSRALKNIILEEMSEKDDIILICTTNFPEQLDKAFLRAGRIDIKLPFLLPDYDARRQILEIHTRVVRKVPLDRDVNLDELARKTSGWTGAEIEQLVKEAIIYALDEAVRRGIKRMKVGMRHFEDAYNNIVVDRKTRAAELDRFVNIAKSLTSHREVIRYVEKQKDMVTSEISIVEDKTIFL